MKLIYSFNYLILLLFLTLQSAYAQQYKVNNAMHLGVEGVFISNEKGESTVTDKNGYFKILSSGNRFTFSHVNYKTQTFSRDYLNKYTTVYLKEEITSLEEIVIGANKWEEKSYENPQQILTIKNEAIANDMPQTTADLIAKTGEIFVQKSQMGGGSPMLRGFAANQILLVVDGVRMNNAIYRNGNLQNILSIDPNSLESAEVIFGPGSVIYGSDALGGVIDLHTKEPQFSDLNYTPIHGDATFRISSATGEGMGNMNINLEGRKLSWLGGLTYSSFKDLRSGSWYRIESDQFGQRKFYVSTKDNNDIIIDNFDNVELQSPSSYQQYSFHQKLKYKLNKKMTILYSLLLTNTDNIPRYDRLTELNSITSNEGQKYNVTMQDIVDVSGNQLITNKGITTPKFSEWYYGPQLWMLNSLKFIHHDSTKLYDNLKVTLAYQKVKEDRHHRKFESDIRENDYVNVDVWSMNIDFLKRTSEKFELVYGIEGTTNSIQSNADSYNIKTGKTEITLPRYAGGGSLYSTLGVYGLGKYHINDKLVASLGLRYAHTFMNLDYTDKASQELQLPYDHFNYNVGNITGSIGIAYHTKKWQMNAQLAKGFKAPNVDDIGKVYNPSKDDLVIPNPDLKPTNVYTIDGTVERRVHENLLIGVNAFYSWLDDAMVRGPYNYNGSDSITIDGNKYAVFALQNTGQARIAGTSLKLNAYLNDFISLTTTYTYTYGRDIINDEALRHIPPMFGKIGLNYTRPRWHIGLSSMFSGGIAYENLAPSEREKPYLYAHEGALSWWTLDFQSSLRVKDFIEVHFNVDNILDQSYRTYSSGINAPGRNLSFSMKGFF